MRAVAVQLLCSHCAVAVLSPIRMSLHMPLRVPVCLSVCISLRMSLCLSIRMAIRMSMHMFAQVVCSDSLSFMQLCLALQQL